MAKAGLALIILGWCCYFAALLLPAIEVGEIVLDGYWQESMRGYRCFLYTVDPRNFLFVPLLILYLCANLLLLCSSLALGSEAGTQKIVGIGLLLCFVLSLSAPWCYSGIRATGVGCYLWMASFALASAGFVLYSRRDKTLGIDLGD